MTDSGKLRAAEAASEPVVLDLNADHPGDLLLAWLRELLYCFSTKKLVLMDFEFTALSEKALRAEAIGKRFNPERDEARHEVKAITYHQFKLEKIKDGWRAEVIVDI